MKILDLSHHFYPGQPHFPGDPDQRTETIATIDDDGFLMHRYCLVGPWGTHIDAPAHFISGGRTLDDIDSSELVLPLVVITFPASGLIGDKEILKHESTHGTIPPESFVALNTGWQWGATGIAPGWSISALQMLHDRSVIAIGHDLPDTDPSLESQHWWLEHDHWQVENMNNLELVPPTGAHIVCAFPVPVAGVSFPLRPIAIVAEPKERVFPSNLASSSESERQNFSAAPVRNSASSDSDSPPGIDNIGDQKNWPLHEREPL